MLVAGHRQNLGSLVRLVPGSHLLRCCARSTLEVFPVPVAEVPDSRGLVLGTRDSPQRLERFVVFSS